MLFLVFLALNNSEKNVIFCKLRWYLKLIISDTFLKSSQSGQKLSQNVFISFAS